MGADLIPRSEGLDFRSDCFYDAGAIGAWDYSRAKEWEGNGALE